MKTALFATLASAVLALGTVAQDARTTPDHPAEAGVVAQADVVLEQYRVDHVDPVELFSLGSSLLGRAYLLRDGTGSVTKVSNLRMLGDTLVLYDTRDQVQRMLEMLARLDVPQEAAVVVESREYAPRYLGLDSVRAAVDGLVDVKLLGDRGIAVMRGAREKLDRALGLLQRLDRPDAQVTITCQLVEVTDAQRGPALPRDLVENLTALLPGTTFSQIGFSMLKTSVGGEPISLQIESTGKRYRLFFIPSAFDPSTGALSVRSCTLTEERDGEGPPRELFRTDALLRAGEYTVLAATGATPRLLVIRVTPEK